MKKRERINNYKGILQNYLKYKDQNVDILMLMNTKEIQGSTNNNQSLRVIFFEDEVRISSKIFPQLPEETIL